MALSRKTPLKCGNSQLSKGKPLSSNSSLKRGGSIKSKPKSPEKIQADKERRDKDLEFYNKIWQSRPHRCVVCNAGLGSEMSTAYMDHLIEKSKHPEFRYEPDNISLVCMNCHSCKTNGFPKPKHQELIEIAQKRFL